MNNLQLQLHLARKVSTWAPVSWLQRKLLIHQNIKQALVDTDERGTHHVYRSMRNTERVFKNKTTMKVNEIEKEHPGD